MKDSFEIAKAENQLLISIAKHSLCSYPILKEVYNEHFINELVEAKRDPDNLLLFWLVNDNEFDSPTARSLLEEIEEMLQPFAKSVNFSLLKLKLRQWNSIPFESTITELEFAFEYYKRGYYVELEPDLPNRRKGDFSATKEKQKIYFEVKMVHKEVSSKNKAAIDQLSYCCHKIDHSFYIGNVDVHENFQRSQSNAVAKFVEKKLRELKANSCNLPVSIDYPDSDNPLVTFDVNERLADEQKGFFGMFTYGGGITTKWTDLRTKIEEGVSQLHPDFPGVVIIRPLGLDYLDYDIKNALFGDLSVNFRTGTAFRKIDRIFAKKKNTRLSAVVLYDKRLQNFGYTKKKIVYHNPFALRKLPKDVFEGENVTQFLIE